MRATSTGKQITSHIIRDNLNYDNYGNWIDSVKEERKNYYFTTYLILTIISVPLKWDKFKY